MTSRETSDVFMPEVPIVIPSEIAIVLSSIGVPPASRMPSLTWWESARRWKLQGIVSIHVEATAISGFESASSSKPMPFRYARAGALSGPSVSARLPDSDDVLAKWMALTGDERRLIATANMHLPGRQVDPKQVRRDLWRLSQWERERLRRGRRSTGEVPAP